MKLLRAAAATLLLSSAAMADWDTEKTRFEAAWAAGSAEGRIAAARAIRDFDCPEGMALLLDRYAGEKDFEVRRALADAMNSLTTVRARDVFRDTILQHPDAEARARFCALFADGRMLDRFEMLRSLLRDASETVRERALRTLGSTDGGLAGDAAKLVSDPVSGVRMAACAALGTMGATDAVPALVRALDEEKVGEIRWAVTDALAKISGQDYGEDAAKWREWWKQKRMAGMPPVELALFKGGEWLRPRLHERLEAYRNATPPIAADPSQKILNARPLPLIVYAMIHAGVPLDDPDMKAGLEVLETMPLSTTYDVALAAMALADADAKRYGSRLAEIAQWLCDQECDNGQWTYGTMMALKLGAGRTGQGVTPTQGAGEPDESGRFKVTWKDSLQRCPRGDNSNTQYALLGLRACLVSVDVPKMPWQLSLAWFRRTQASGGSWHYGGSDSRSPGYGSMTAGGVSSVAICMRALGMDEELQADRLHAQKEIQSAMNWIGAQFSVTANPSNSCWQYYWLYGIERAGMILGVVQFGKHDWYLEGSKMLIEAQSPDGSWLSTDGIRNADNDTCFAILFLRKATRGYTLTGQGGK